MSIQDLRKEHDKRRGEERQTIQNLNATKTRVQEAKKDLVQHEQAREVIRAAGLKTQETLAFHISDITTLALHAVFPEPYDLVVEFVHRRNKTECDLRFERLGIQINPMDGSGGGAIDVASFALRVASWAMERPRTSPVIILDEPMRFLSTDLQPKASEMLKQISKRLGLQFIIVTHEEELTEAADKVFKVTMHKTNSKVND